MALKKYWKIYWIYFKTSLSRDLSFRLNFIASIFGSFCYVALDFFIIVFLMNKINFGEWTIKEMYILLGNYFILTYALFFLFWRGFILLIRNIRNGIFDFYLIKPADSQFLVSTLGGGIHNLLALIFGVCTVIYGLSVVQIYPNWISILCWLITMIIVIIDTYSYCLLLLTLNFKFGYLEEVLTLSLSFQDFSRYPVDAFLGLPLFLLIFALPFSAMSTIPSKILIYSTENWISSLLVFAFLSFVFIFFVRIMWLLSLKSYTSSN